MNTIQKIKDAEKRTQVKVYLNEKHEDLKTMMYQYVVIGEWKKIKEILEKYKIDHYYVETDTVNSALPLMDTKELKVRIEPGAIIREGCVLEENAIILMGAILNANCHIGKKTMVDMGAVIGGHVVVGDSCHIGANAVLAGKIEPYHEKGVVIGHHTFIGAGAVILEGVHIGNHVLIGANAVVTHDIEDYSVAAGVPAKILRTQKDDDEWLVEDLRKI